MLRLCAMADVPEGDAKGYESPDGEVIVAQWDGQFYAYRNMCPHLGIELNFQPDAFMDLDRRFLQCANHDALFRIEDGHCIAGPCSGQKLTSVPIVLKDGDVWLQAESE